MLTHEEHQAMIMFDRLLMAAKDNETVADLLDQTLNVARMIDPRSDEKISYGPLQRMHFEWQQMKHQMNELEKKMNQYANAQHNRYYTTPGTWPSNPGLDINMGYPQTTTSGTGAIGGGYQQGYGATPPMTWGIDINEQNIKPVTSESLKKMVETMKMMAADPTNKEDDK